MCCHLVLKTQHTIAGYKSTVTDKKPENKYKLLKNEPKNNGGHKKNTFIQIKLR